VTLTWHASTSNVTGYRVYRSTSPAVTPELLAVVPAEATEYTDASVQPGMTYYYAVTAVGESDNEGPFSDTVSATIPAR
jgi:fibronectin type 3 domain-containing protein